MLCFQFCNISTKWTLNSHTVLEFHDESLLVDFLFSVLHKNWAKLLLIIVLYCIFDNDIQKPWYRSFILITHLFSLHFEYYSWLLCKRNSFELFVRYDTNCFVVYQFDYFRVRKTSNNRTLWRNHKMLDKY